MLRDLLLVLNMLVCLALIGVVLLQRSEGGAFGTGSPMGLVTARGAGDLLTRTTWVLFTLFLSLSLALTLIGGRERSSRAILQRLKSVTVNPDQLATPAPPASSNAPSPAQSPARAAPPPLQLPPLESAAALKPRTGHAKPAPVVRSQQSDTSNPPAPTLATPAPLALPPLPSPTNSQTKPPTP